jgi:hypothetical protein
LTDVLIYWRDYKQNWTRQFAEDRTYYWHSNAKLLGGLKAGDQLWVVTSGAKVGHEARHAGFLVAIWTVTKAGANPGDDPAYPPDDYRFRIVADPDESIAIEEPVAVDHILRPHGRDKAVSIGRYLQGPRKLDEQKVRLLRAAAGPELALKWLTGTKIGRTPSLPTATTPITTNPEQIRR